MKRHDLNRDLQNSIEHVIDREVQGGKETPEYFGYPEGFKSNAALVGRFR